MLNWLRASWRRLSPRRNAIELATLRLAVRLGPFAMLPVASILLGWWLVGTLPILFGLVAASLIGINVLDPGAQAGFFQIIMAFLLWLILGGYALVLMVLFMPWVFQWYFIALALTFGRTAMADRKEAELVAAIAAAGREGVA